MGGRLRFGINGRLHRNTQRSAGCIAFRLSCLVNRSPSQHARYDEALLDKIKDSFKDSDRTYGAGVSGTTSSPKASPVVCIASSVSCATNH